ncbi:hypothetical protein [Paenibacillus sp. RC67]|uniref:hypothetical protein n=1 Tax=Paenibacillus sp. RC67 TaxID=3039392 RepID=UPI0024ADAC8D|nr:hypothetical protein [Paenibacillus sp. RC67]
MSKKRNNLIIVFGIMLASMVFVAQAHANLFVGSLVILKDSPMYDVSSLSQEPVGIVSAPQQVSVKDTLPKQEDGDIEWFLVETWLGDKWIPASDKVATGSYHTEDRDITLVQETRLFDLQQSYDPTDLMIPPQKVKVLGTYTTLQLQGAQCHFSSLKPAYVVSD